MSELEEQRARGIPTTVVTAVTEKGIVRGISHFTRPTEIRAEVERAVGVLDEVQWSTYTYRLPYYAELMGGFSSWDVPSGVYLFRWTETTTDWRDPKRRYSVSEPELLFRPRGWATGRKT